MKKVIVIAGPTAVGKSNLAVELAKGKIAEIISADTRQVYRCLDIGSGKIQKHDMCGIKHHMLDIVNPGEEFSVSDYEQLGIKILKEMENNNILPFIVGGSGYYIESLLYDGTYSKVPKNNLFRKSVELISTENLFLKIQKNDYQRALSIDKYNRQRLIRALEIIERKGEVKKLKKEKRFDYLYIGLKLPQYDLYKKIENRLENRWSYILKEGEILVNNGVSKDWLYNLGLEYRAIAEILSNHPEQDVKARLLNNIKQYTKRQYTWFKKQKNLKWYHPCDIENISLEIKKFCGSTRT